MKKNKVVIQKYLEKGHTQMECDSIHSVIERRLRDQDVYLPAEYVNLMKRAIWSLQVSAPWSKAW